MPRSKNPKPEVLDTKRIVVGVPPDHWTWLGEGRTWARFMLFEQSRGISLDSSYLYRIKPSCGIGTCIRPSHLKIRVQVLPEELMMRGLTPHDLNEGYKA